MNALLFATMLMGQQPLTVTTYVPITQALYPVTGITVTTRRSLLPFRPTRTQVQVYTMPPLRYNQVYTPTIMEKVPASHVIERQYLLEKEVQRD